MFSEFTLPGNQGKQGDTPDYVLLFTVYEYLLCVRGSHRNSVISVLLQAPLPYDEGRGTQGLDAEDLCKMHYPSGQLHTWAPYGRLHCLPAYFRG